MEDVKKKCVLCGSEFIATDDNKPNHQICCRCSQQLTRHINPKICLLYTSDAADEL